MCKLETDPSKFCLVLTVFHRIKKPCYENPLDSEPSAYQQSLSGTCVSMSVITAEPVRYEHDHERAIRCPCSQPVTMWGLPEPVYGEPWHSLLSPIVSNLVAVPLEFQWG